MEEKTKVLVHRLTWLIITCLIFFIPIIINWAQPELVIVDDEAYIEDYYEYSDTSTIEMYITFNREVSSGYATINFYDASGSLLDTQENYFYTYGDKSVEDTYISVDGKVDSYEIVSYDFKTLFIGSEAYFFLLPAILFLIESLLVSYKEYDYNGKKLSVYAGFYHHTLRVDGEKCDEHNTITTFSPIYLSTTMKDGTVVDATITLTNRISLKVNDKLLSKQIRGNKKDTL